MEENTDKETDHVENDNKETKHVEDGDKETELAEDGDKTNGYAAEGVKETGHGKETTVELEDHAVDKNNDGGNGRESPKETVLEVDEVTSGV